MHITYNLVTGPLGGEIDVQSRPGEGCRVLITLPLVAPGQRTGSAING
jgi:signal transduction histidine kinase